MGIESDDDLQLAVGCRNVSARLDPINLEPIADILENEKEIIPLSLSYACR